ncbi:AGAP006144-PA-like protein [Anopheles sinensis]|uniref:Metalloendopeptidase n=1 Tax=Anopheles sinensis TaxID=74873 RepID=A0A084WEP9_ANOSI|nr:AGAP006144-PA-like protein [Anopheles sinensis]
MARGPWLAPGWLVCWAALPVVLLPVVPTGGRVVGGVSGASRRYRDYDFDFSHLGEAVYGNHDQAAIGELVRTWARQARTNGTKGNPEELGTYAEGDIHQPLIERNALKFTSSKWKNGVVPYEFSDEFSIGDLQKLFSAFEQFHKKTCIRFVPHTKERDYVVIEGRNSGCWSAVGRMGGRQVLNLQRNGCLQMEGTIVHELMHVLGFLHEHTRYDRDRYVNIYFRNVRPNLLSNFGRESESQTTTLGMAYDYGSVMHYSRTAFSKNGKATVEPKIKYSGQLGQRVGFSLKDVQKINKLYCHR